MENWKPVVGYEGLYEVSDTGKLRNSRVMKELTLVVNKDGYHQVTLRNPLRNTFRIHRLVLEAFVGESTLVCNHKNGIKTDNRLENLEYCTQTENILHKFRVLGCKANKTGTGKFGKLNGHSKPVVQTSLTGEFIRRWDSMMDIVRENGIRVQYISKNCTGAIKSTHGFIFKFDKNDIPTA